VNEGIDAPKIAQCLAKAIPHSLHHDDHMGAIAMEA
jgi:hypothetical protein